jgi:hypothetical protein
MSRARALTPSRASLESRASLAAFALAGALGMLGALGETGCSTPADARVVVTPPDRASFPAVAELLVHRCGSLDCHGTRARNLRLFGREGLRWASTDLPYVTATTPDEVDEDYQSVVALEPEVMSSVIADHGAHPERLTLVRKARGTESHKGGALITPGDAQDACITSWLAGSADGASCKAALALP